MEIHKILNAIKYIFFVMTKQPLFSQVNAKYLLVMYLRCIKICIRNILKECNVFATSN